MPSFIDVFEGVYHNSLLFDSEMVLYTYHTSSLFHLLSAALPDKLYQTPENGVKRISFNLPL